MISLPPHIPSQLFRRYNFTCDSCPPPDRRSAGWTCVPSCVERACRRPSAGRQVHPEVKRSCLGSQAKAVVGYGYEIPLQLSPPGAPPTHQAPCTIVLFSLSSSRTCSTYSCTAVHSVQSTSRGNLHTLAPRLAQRPCAADSLTSSKMLLVSRTPCAYRAAAEAAPGLREGPSTGAHSLAQARACTGWAPEDSKRHG